MNILLYTFRGGSYVAEHKNTENSPIVKMPAPRTVSIPLSQHIGAGCVPLVNVGDRVLYGQMIGNTSSFGCPVHSSVSGTVIDITYEKNAFSETGLNVVIENDGLYEPSPDISPCEKKLNEVSTKEIIEIVHRAGIVGMGGKNFPTYEKIRASAGKVKRLIINCTECEPYLTTVNRLILERTLEIINGAKILLKALGLRNADFVIENNKPSAIEKLEEKLGDSNMFSIRVMQTKYPQGDERQIIYALTGKELPENKLPIDVGCAVFNAETCSAIYRAFAFGMPSVEKLITVDGDSVKTPRNLLVPIGTSYKNVIDFCGGLKASPKKLIHGGAMMGYAQENFFGVVTKATSALLLFSDAKCREEEDGVCINCGRCTQVCPMRLMPGELVQLIEREHFDKAQAQGLLSCVECGLCAYNCPARIRIVEYIVNGKRALESKKISDENESDILSNEKEVKIELE